MVDEVSEAVSLGFWMVAVHLVRIHEALQSNENLSEMCLVSGSRGGEVVNPHRWPSYAEEKYGPDAIFWIPDEDIVESDPDELSDEEKERRRKRNQKRARQRRRQRTRDALKGKP